MKKNLSVRSNQILRISAFAVSVLCHLTAVILFILYYKNLMVVSRFTEQFYTLAGISAIVSILLYLTKEPAATVILLILHYILLFLIGYPLGHYIGIELILYSALIIEISFYTHPPVNRIIQILIFPLFIISQQGSSAWWQETSRVSSHDLIAAASYTLLIIFLSLALKQVLMKSIEKSTQIEHLDAAISQLTDANIGFQSYVKNLEIQTLIEERKRVSREIHDTVGYALTNIIMMMEAGVLLNDNEKEKRNNLLTTARDQAQKGLAETRAALRHLRNEKPVKPFGIDMIEELVSAFRQATGISIQIEYGNLPGFTNEKIDAIIFRIIQEGLTNAFRHGMATIIRINFWVSGGYLRISIHDNGVGSKEIVEGIGVAGMRERVFDIGGKINIRNVEDGFKIDAEIPLEKNVG